MPDVTLSERRRELVPSEYRSAQWARVPVWIKEQSFFSAGVTNLVVLQVMRDAATAVDRGELSEAEGRRKIREALDVTNYKPEPGQEGTIKDLREVNRMNVMLRTQVAQHRGWGAEEEQRKVARVWPAKQLVRVSPRKEPRVWPVIWREGLVAAQQMGAPAGEATLDPMVAVIGHPVWVAISDFGVPHDPLRWNTGMRQKPVRADKARQYGISLRREEGRAENGEMENGEMGRAGGAGRADQRQTVELVPGVSVPRPVSSPGEALELRSAGQMIRDADLREMATLGGLGRWENREMENGEMGGNGGSPPVLIFTDPNGTRPVTVAEAVELLQVRNPAGSGRRMNYQLRALSEAVESIRTGTLAQWMAEQAGTDVLDDFTRLCRRLQREPGEGLGDALLRLAAGLARALE